VLSSSLRFSTGLSVLCTLTLRFLDTCPQNFRRNVSINMTVMAHIARELTSVGNSQSVIVEEALDYYYLST
jgi:hypothetical protein